ncbi:DUF4240 domain-containing protein [Frondihabitans cladoniiphilus]|uniref:DUF4240 domain-containing protein n=1 Tax=Frondihabitans cladoniiphilus TaxID=715785 RepID=A0ABP8VN88_9MICO
MPSTDYDETSKLALPDDLFWDLIDVLGGQVDEDSLGALRDALAALSEDQLLGFHAALTVKLHDLDTAKAHEWMRENDEAADELGVSDDVFLYARAATVAAGTAVMERAEGDGTVFLEEDDPGSAEALLYVAEEAADQAGYDIDFASIALSYETGSNTEGWKED